jgi:hypothetical protein
MPAPPEGVFPVTGAGSSGELRVKSAFVSDWAEVVTGGEKNRLRWNRYWGTRGTLKGENFADCCRRIREPIKMHGYQQVAILLLRQRNRRW